MAPEKRADVYTADDELRFTFSPDDRKTMSTFAPSHRCFCASLLRMQIYTSRHASMRAPGNKLKKRLIIAVVKLEPEKKYI